MEVMITTGMNNVAAATIACAGHNRSSCANKPASTVSGSPPGTRAERKGTIAAIISISAMAVTGISKARVNSSVRRAGDRLL